MSHSNGPPGAQPDSPVESHGIPGKRKRTRKKSPSDRRRDARRNELRSLDENGLVDRIDKAARARLAVPEALSRAERSTAGVQALADDPAELYSYLRKQRRGSGAPFAGHTSTTNLTLVKPSTASVHGKWPERKPRQKPRAA